MVLPPQLLDDVQAAKGEREQYSSATEQLTLADFVRCGAYEPPGTERAVVKAAAWQGLAVEGLADFRRPGGGPGEEAGRLRDGLVVGYATPPEHLYTEALDALCRALPPA